MPAKKTTASKRRSSAAARKPFWQGVTEWLLNIGKKIVPLALLVWLIGWLWLGGVMTQTRDWIWTSFVNWTAGQGLVVQNIIVTGRDRTDLKSLNKAIGVDRNDPLLSVDVDDIQQKIALLPWVKTTLVRRTYDGMIEINLVERIPFVLWQRPEHKSLVVVDTDGNVIDGAKARDFSDFLIIAGANAPDHIVPLMQNLMAEPEIASRIKKAEWISDRRWDIVTIQDMRINLPEDDIGYALSRLVKLNQEKAILDERLKSIDLRSSDRIIIEPHRGEARDIMNLSSATQSGFI